MRIAENTARYERGARQKAKLINRIVTAIQAAPNEDLADQESFLLIVGLENKADRTPYKFQIPND